MHSKPNEKLIQRVIKTSESTNFINKLKYGLKTNVGEKGQKFSGGERQRISLMRALYQCPNILILDEFSSAIDKETSLKIYKNLRSIKSDKIIISISHDKNIETFVDKTFLIKDKAVRIQNG